MFFMTAYFHICVCFCTTINYSSLGFIVPIIAKPLAPPVPPASIEFVVRNELPSSSSANPETIKNYLDWAQTVIDDMPEPENSSGNAIVKGLKVLSGAYEIYKIGKGDHPFEVPPFSPSEVANKLTESYIDAGLKLGIIFVAERYCPGAGRILAKSEVADFVRPHIQKAIDDVQANLQHPSLNTNPDMKRLFLSNPFAVLTFNPHPFAADHDPLDAEKAVFEYFSWPSQFVGSLVHIGKEGLRSLSKVPSVFVNGIVSYWKGYIGRLEEIEKNNGKKIERKEPEFLKEEKSEQSEKGQEKKEEGEQAKSSSEKEPEAKAENKKTSWQIPKEVTEEFKKCNYNFNITTQELLEMSRPRPPETNPILNLLGGQVHANNSGGQLNAGGQINVTLWGSKNSPGDPRYNGDPRYKGAAAFDSQAGGPHYGKRKSPGKETLNAWNQFVADRNEVIKKRSEVKTLNDAISTNGTIDERIQEHQNAKNMADATITAEQKLRQDGFNFYKNHSSMHVCERKFPIETWGPRSIMQSELEKVFFEEQGVSKPTHKDSFNHERIKQEHINAATGSNDLITMRDWHDQQIASLNQQKQVKTNEEQYADSFQKFLAQGQRILDLENSSGAVDPRQMKESLAAFENLGNQLLPILDKLAAFSGIVDQEKIKNLRADVHQRLQSAKNRDYGFAKIVSNCQQILGDNQTGLSDEELKEKADRENNQIAKINEFIEQCPENKERNDALSKLRNVIQAKRDVYLGTLQTREILKSRFFNQ